MLASQQQDGNVIKRKGRTLLTDKSTRLTGAGMRAGGI